MNRENKLITIATIGIAILFILLLLGGIAHVNAATYNMSAWDGKSLPELGLQPPTPGLKFSYVQDETGIPASWDWRSTPNGTRVTPVKDQGGCGSCVAYAVVAQIESDLEIARNSNKPAPDLAEMDLFSHGGECESGWDFDRAYPAAKTYGIQSQACYDSGTCSDKSSDKTYIKGWSTTKTPKEALLSGPIVTGTAWDFNWFYYDGGIIDEYNGDVAGYHALCIVGYNDPGQYWIVKNSWGPSWGESGYFRIKYDVAAAAGFGTDFPWYVADVGSSPGPGPGPTPANKTWTASTLSKPTGAYSFGLSSPEDKAIMTTTAYSKAVKFGEYPADQKFLFKLKTPKGTFLSNQKSYATIWSTSSGGYWIYWTGVNGIKYKNDAIIEIKRQG